MKSKQSAARRRKHEANKTSHPPADPVDELSWSEVRTLLDEEIARLSDPCRSVFILSILENLSRAETARRLGLQERTVSRRLAEARKRLQQRLARRGVELAAVLAAPAVATETASALPPALLVKAIERTASPAVTALARGGSSLLNWGKVKLSAAILLAASVLSGAGVWAYREPAAEPLVASENDKPKEVSPKREAAKTVEISGRVLDPDGKPKAGAKLLLSDHDGGIESLGVSGADGRFAVAVPTETKERYLVAQASGTGIDFLSLRQEKSQKVVEFRLVKDNPIRGRVVNTEGRPIRGVRVSAHDISVYVNNTLDTFLAGYIKVLAGGKGNAPRKVLWNYNLDRTLFADTTDAEGRFVLHDIGTERTVQLHFRSGGVAFTTLFYVVNRAGFDPKSYNREFRARYTKANGSKDQRWIPAHLLYGPDLTVVAESEKIIRGVVKDADTGKVQPNLSIRLTGYWDETVPSFHPTAKTDAEGRYEIHGARKATKYLVQFHGDETTGYAPSQIWAEDTAGYQPVQADLQVKKGVIITGKVIDRATGKSIPGTATAAVLFDNPFVKDYHYDEFFPPANGLPYFARGAMDSNGVFRIVTLPGPVLLMGGPTHNQLEPLEALRFKSAIADPKYPKYFHKRTAASGETRLTYRGIRGLTDTVDGDFCKVLDIKPGVAVVKQDIVLERASVRTLKIQDAEGRPLAGVWVTGIGSGTGYAIHLDKDSCPVYQLEAGKPRQMIFCEPSRKLAATRTFLAEEKAPLAVKLAAMGSLKGRLLGADGKPLAGLEIDLHYREAQAESIHDAIHKGKQIVTAANGAFAFEELLPDVEFTLTFRRGRRPLQRIEKTAETAMQVKPGECRDLGAIKLKRVSDKAKE